MKIKITPRKKGDRGILCMPLKANVPKGRPDWRIVHCPVCGAECWESDLTREVLQTEPNITAACTNCALQEKKGGNSHR